MMKSVELHRLGGYFNYNIEVHIIQRMNVCRHQITKSSRFLAFNPFESDIRKKKIGTKARHTGTGEMVLQHIILRAACITYVRLI